MGKVKAIHRIAPGGIWTMCNKAAERDDVFGADAKVGKDWNDVTCGKCARYLREPSSTQHFQIRGGTLCGIKDPVKLMSAERTKTLNRVTCEGCLAETRS